MGMMGIRMRSRSIIFMTGRTGKSIFMARAGHKVDALRVCDKVCFTVYGNETIREEDWAPFMQSTVVFGKCHLMENGSEKAMEMLKRFAMKYYPNEQLADEEIAQAGRAVQMFEIEIEHLSGKEVQEK